MTYHTYLQEAAAGLGAEVKASVSGGVVTKYSAKIGYMGLNKAGDAVTSKLLAERGAGSGFEGYAFQAGQAGGTAICAPYGAFAAGLCGKFGGVAAGVLAGMFGKAPDTWQTPGIWNKYTVPSVRIAQQGVAAVRRYLTARDQLLDEVAAIMNWLTLDAAREWANNWLSARGLPPAPIDPRWAPREDLWLTFKEFAPWAENPITTPPYGYKPGTPTSTYTKVSNGVGGECVLANKLPPLECSQVITAMTYPAGVPSPPGTGIDWGMVGAFQLVLSPSTNVVAICIPNKFEFTKNISGMAQQCTCVKRPGVESGTRNCIVADVLPSQLAVKFSLDLDEKRPQLIALAKQEELKRFAGAAAKVYQLQQAAKKKPVAVDTSKAQMMKVLGVGLFAAGGYAAYRLWKKK